MNQRSTPGKLWWLLPLLFSSLLLISQKGFSQLTPACSPNYPSGNFSWYLSPITIGSFNHTPASSTHDYTSLSFTASAGQTLAVTVVAHGWLSVGTAADWNNDGDFDDPGEVLDLQNYAASDPHTYNYNITIPPNVLTGSYRFRLFSVGGNAGNGNPANSPCGTYGYGSWVDYTINVVNTAGCQPPTGLTADQVQPTSVSFHWTSANPVPSNGYFWKVVNNGDDPNLVPGVASGSTTDTFVTANNLNSTGNYKVYVLSNCGNDSSLWSLPISVLTPCDGTPTAGTITASVPQIYGGQSFSLNSGSTTSSGTGISYKWQSAPLLQNNWTDVTGATTTTLTQTMQASIRFRLIVSCLGSGLSDTSNVVTVYLEAPDYVPVALSGFNFDVIANGIGSATSSTNNDLDGANYDLVAQDFQATPVSTLPTKFVPNSRSIQNAEKWFMLNDYSQNNTLRKTSGQSGTLIFLTPKRAKKVYVLGVSGSGVSTVNATLNFDDGTTQIVTGLSWPDWFATTGDVVASQVGRVNRTNNGVESGPGPQLVENLITIDTANQQKQIDSITFNIQSGSNVMNVLAVSIIASDTQACPPPSNLDLVSIQDHAATVSWHANGTGNDFQISYALPGVAAANGTFATVNNDTTYNITGLTDNTAYNVFVRTNCGSGTYSDWIGPLNIHTTLTNCSGQPNAGQIDSTSFSICAGIPFMLTDTGYTLAGGIGLQWQQKTGATSWQDISGATTGILNFPNGLGVNTQYRFYVTCSFSNTADTSNPITISMNPGNQCYCTVTSTNSSFGIGNFTTTNGITNINNTTGSGTYTDYSSTMSVSQAAGDSIDFSITSVLSSAGMGIWIDWNDNGNFTDTLEHVFNSGAFVTGSTGTIVVPANQPSGNYRMRVVANFLASSPTPCGDLGSQPYGEAEDYTFTVVSLNACAGPVTAGVVNNGNGLNVCAGNSFSLTATGYTAPATGLTYHWQQRSPSGTGNWQDIIGATNAGLTVSAGITVPTDYRFYVVCSNGSATDTGAAVTVNLNPANQCYCTPTGTQNTTDDITNFTLANLNNSSTSGSGTTAPGYSDFTASVAPADLLVGQSYVATVSSGTGSGAHGAAIWIDYNDNGVFESSEMVANISSSIQGGTTGTFPAFVVPANPGTHRLRVQYVWDQNGTALTPCSVSTQYGETEDYLVSINAPVCNIVADTLTATNIGSTSAVLSWTGQAQQYLIEYGPAGFTQGTGTIVLTTFNPDTLTGLNPNTDYDFYVQNICYPGFDSADWSVNPGSFITLCDTPFVNLGLDTTICEGTPFVLGTGNSSLSNSYLWSDGSSDSTLAVVSSGTYWVSLTDIFDCSNTDTVLVNVTPIPHVTDITAIHNPDDTYTFTANGVSAGVTYNWDFGDNSGTATTANPTYTYGDYGDYTVTLVVSNQCGSDTTQLIVHYQSDGIHQVDPGKDLLKLYPNPAKDRIMLKNESNRKMQSVEVYNVLGQRILRTNTNNTTAYQLSVDGFASGIYSMKIFFEDGTWAQRKFEIAR